MPTPNQNESSRGIYVEIFIESSIDHVWRLTQEPDLHEKWDLRFSQIRYLPRPNPAEPQRFLYSTRIGFGLAINGTGESMGQRASATGESTSALKFASDDPKSLILQGSGYWRYVPVESGVRFLTWYDYQVRFGFFGRLIDRVAFRPLIGWATAWSFDRLRLWAEGDQSPQCSATLALIHASARLAIAFVWIWHGLIPKLLFRNIDERRMLGDAGVPLAWLPFIGLAEIAFGVLVLFTRRQRWMFFATGVLMVTATIAVAVNSPSYLEGAFNPVTLNLAVLFLCLVGWLSSRTLPSATRCLRQAPPLSTQSSQNSKP